MASLKTRFEEIIHLDWGEFIALEQDKGASVDDVVLCSLVRVCADTDDIAAIKLAFDRIDGLQDTLIEIKVPKFYTRYVNAKEIEQGPKQIEAPEGAKASEPASYDPATAKLRETLKEMRKMPRDVIRVVKLYKKRIEDGKPVEHKPKVKSVIVANLLKHVTKGRFRAIELVFDQIDGKLPKAINLLGGDDVYVDDYTELVAPSHAQLDEKGVYYAENKAMTAGWLRGFAQSQKGLEILAEGLDND
ncbi:MAG TPA: hypothetical protein VD907_07030 [Verrucomicrobiae bacterium]|nr:hypothetical protein [Verrucomicrobiae bacterium]